MASSWDAQSLEAIPESATVSYQPGSAHPSPSPRSTSDNPAWSPGSQPISQHSRLLQPTLSWQAKAAWLPDPVADASTSVMDHGFVDNITQVQVSTAALTARNQALAAGRRTSLISPSTSFRARDAVRMSADDARGKDSIGHAANDYGTTSSTVQHSSNSQVAQQKADRLTSLLHDELAKRGKPAVAPWQQQRVQLRPVTASDGSFTSRSGSVTGTHSADASVDTLQQQRTKLKPVQTSNKSLKPVAAPTKPHNTTPAPSSKLQSANFRLPAPAAGVKAAPQLVSHVQQQAQRQAMQPVASQTSQLRSKFSQLTALLQSTALQRGISLSQVAVPATRKPTNHQPQRISLEDLRTNFRSFTEASSSNSSSKSPPVRRVSTGAITPAFLQQKHRQDKALLASLGVADAGTDSLGPVWQPMDDSAVANVAPAAPIATATTGRSSGSIAQVSLASASTGTAISLSDVKLQSSALHTGNSGRPHSTADTDRIPASNAEQSTGSGSAAASNVATGSVAAGSKDSQAETSYAALSGDPPSTAADSQDWIQNQGWHSVEGGVASTTEFEADTGTGAKHSLPALSSNVTMPQTTSGSQTKSGQQTEVDVGGIKASGVNVSVSLANADGQVVKKAGVNSLAKSDVVHSGASPKSSVHDNGGLTARQQEQILWQRLLCCGCCTKG